MHKVMFGRSGQVVAALAVAAIVATACSSNTKSDAGGATTPTAQTSSSVSVPTGTPILLGALMPTGTSGQNYPNVIAAIKAAVRGVNARGGVAGHPLKLDVCNEGGTPTTAAACARRFVSDGVVASIRGYSITGSDQINQILSSAHIPEIFVSALVPSQFTSVNSFPIGGGPAQDQAALFIRGKELGKTKYALASLDVAALEPINALEALAAKNLGLQITTLVKIPFTAADYAPFATKIVNSGAQAVLLGLTPSATVSLISAIQDAGGSDILFLQAANGLSPADLKALGKTGANLQMSSPTPPFSAADQFPEFQILKSDFEAEIASGNKDVDYLNSAVEGWLGVQLVSKVASTMSGDITAQALEDALNAAKDVNLGLVPPMTPGVKGPTSNTRVTDFFDYFTSLNKDGTVTLLSKDPVNVLPAVTGS